jgi:hypothetical protein
LFRPAFLVEFAVILNRPVTGKVKFDWPTRLISMLLIPCFSYYTYLQEDSGLKYASNAGA